MAERTPLVVVGLGTSVRGDDGLGAAVIDLLTQGYDVPDGIHLTTGHLPDVDGASAVIVVSAIPTAAPPGSFVRLSGAEAATVPSLPALAGAWLERGRARPPAALIALGLVPASCDPGAGLSRPVAAGLLGLVRHVVVEARRLGHDLQRRPAAPAAA